MSDVVNEYFKLALEKGWVKESQKTREEHYSDKEYREKILALYGLDIKLNDSDKDIVEQAHPDTVVVAPSYDKTMARVENLNEQHDMSCGIAMRPPRGNLTGHKYASQELISELLKIAFDAEHNDNEEVRKMADACLVKVTNQTKGVIKKEAFLGIITLMTLFGAAEATAVGVSGIAAAVAGLTTATAIAFSARNHIVGYVTTGLDSDSEQAIESLEDGKSYADNLTLTVLNSAIEDIKEYVKYSNKILPVIASATEKLKLNKIDSKEKAKEAFKARKEINEIKQYHKISTEFVDRLEEYRSKLSNARAKYDKDSWVANQEWFASGWQAATNFLGVSGFKDQVNQLARLQSGIEETMKKVSQEAHENSNHSKGLVEQAAGYFMSDKKKK